MDEETVQLAVKLIPVSKVLLYLLQNTISKNTHEMHMQYMAQKYYSMQRFFFKPAFTYIVTVKLYAY